MNTYKLERDVTLQNKNIFIFIDFSFLKKEELKFISFVLEHF